jgi:tRNA pseudouridine55 synthase
LNADGVLVVDKPLGPTSHDIVSQARRVFGTRSIGHAGTLDPLATGVLLLLLGEAKKLSNYLTDEDKTYRAEVSFGRSTDSLDREGQVTAETPLAPDWCSLRRLEQAIEAERSRRRQQPPQLSAIKVAGRPAHRRFRAGESPALAERSVRVERLDLESFEGTVAIFVLTTSKGYYVRAFARDLGQQLGVPAHLSALRRLASGQWQLQEAVSWPTREIPTLTPTREAALRCLPSSQLTQAGAQRCRQGKLLVGADFSGPISADDTSVRVWLDDAGQLAALGQQVSPGQYKVVRGFTAR